MFSATMTRRWLTIALLAVVSLIAAACGSSSDDAVVVADGDVDTDVDEAMVDDVEEAVVAEDEEAAEPAMEEDGGAETASGPVLTTADGGQIDFGSLEGQDTVLWFWAPW